LPAWASEAARPERAAAPLAPSRAARRPEADEERLAEGRLAHALAQYLPDLPIEMRPAAAARFLSARGERLSTERREAIAASVAATIALPELADLFGANSRAEVALAGALPRVGGAPVPIGGRIDRIVVGEDVVTIADFKSGAAPAAPPASYILQLALYRAALAPLYPGRRVEALLIYLGGPTVVRVSEVALERAMERIHR
jgi:ATP-dependent helicase/nuclease subunit A